MTSEKNNKAVNSFKVHLHVKRNRKLHKNARMVSSNHHEECAAKTPPKLRSPLPLVASVNSI